MRPPNHELIDRLAAEYVLGTLRGAARARFARWLERPSEPSHRSAGAAVRRWEDRLVHLADEVQPVDPSPRVWRQIAQRTRAPATSRASHWRPWALAASLMLVAFSAWLYFGPDREDARWQIAAELREPGQAASLWRVEFDDRRATLRVTATRPPPLPASAAHELWALADGGAAPVSLGLLPQSGAIAVRLSAAQRAAFIAAGKLAVSREPAGGSPTGSPTGPVIVVTPRAPIVTST